MRWKDMVGKLEGLLDELTEVAAESATLPPRLGSDPEKEADRWVRRYVRSQTVKLPADQVISILLARATYAATFARLAPRQDIELSTANAAELVEILMVDLWYGCFRKNWLKNEAASQPNRPSKPVVQMDSRYFRHPAQGQREVWN